MAHQQTITGELRRWHRSFNSKGDPCVIGHMYNDTHDIWEDGEDAVIFYSDWVESVNFYLAVCKLGAIKCPKDEEDTRHALKNVNGGSEAG
jgi:hypothetical protein